MGNYRVGTGDYGVMSCPEMRVLLSAQLDGELDTDDVDLVAQHLSGCADCRAHQDALQRLHRAVRVREASPVPDLRESILQGSGRFERRQRRVEALRYVAAVVGATQLILAVPELLGRHADAGVHVSRHLGGWVFAFAAGLIVAGVQPWRARGMLPMVAVLMVVTGVTAVLDLVGGRTELLAELGTHLLELAGLLVMWLLGRWYPIAGPASAGRIRFRFGPAVGAEIHPESSQPSLATAGPMSASANASSRSVRARETRDRIVPIGQEQTAAASS